MFDNKLWHHALKLNKGIYKTTEHLSDAEILKKQLREQTNEILSTISVFCSRESVYPEQGRRASPDLHSALSFFPSASPENGSPAENRSPKYSLPTSASALPPQDSIRQPADKYHDYYLPESEICLLLLLDKITVLKTFLFLAKEHNFFNEEKHQILTAACVHLSDSVQSELHGADIFSHPVFNSDHSLFPSASALPENGSPAENRSPKHSLPTSPKDETLSDILDNLSDIIHENTENISDNLSDISMEVVPPLDMSPFGRSPAGRRPPKIDSALSDNLSDTPNKKAENYISKSIKSRQNKFFKSYFPKFLNRPSFSAFPENGSPAENRSPKYSLPASPEVAPLSLREIPRSGTGGPTSEYSPSAFAEIPQNAPSSIAIEESPQFDFLAIYSAPAYSIFTPSANVPPGGTEVVPPLGFGGPTSKHSPSTSSDLVRHLTPRQQKLHDFIVAKSASSPSAPLPASESNVKIGDLTPLFPEKISEKTIRRDLQVLINNSLIAQSGSRRWTQYSLR